MTLIFPADTDIIFALRYGDVPKWLKGADSKSARRCKACGGSNPSISAKRKSTLRGAFSFGEIEIADLNRSECNLPGAGCSRRLDGAKQ